MSEKIDKTLKKIAGDTSKATTPTSSNIERQAYLAGAPDCPICGGLGYLRRDLPVGHPEFGRLEMCSCRNAEVSQLVRDRLFALSNLDELRHLTFETFQPRGQFGLRPAEADSLERAFNQARQYAQSLNGWLLLMGKYGCGKTHLAAAVANYAVDMGVPTLFITVPDMLDQLRFAYDDPEETFEQRFDQVRNARLLVLDDFGTQNATPWAQEKLFQIINYRYINHLPLVVTTNLGLFEIEARIRSRLEDPEMVTPARILATDYRKPMRDRSQSDLSILDLIEELTFANFDLREHEGLDPADTRSLANAFQVAREFAEHPEGWLVLMGGYASGKTHLAGAIANYRADIGQDVNITDLPSLFDYLRATFNQNSTVSLDRRFEEIKTTPLLILDDLGSTSTAWVKEKLFQLLNYRYLRELPTVLTTANTMDEIDPRLRSRILDARLCRIVAITVPSYHGKPRRARTRRKKQS